MPVQCKTLGLQANADHYKSSEETNGHFKEQKWEWVRLLKPHCTVVGLLLEVCRECFCMHTKVYTVWFCYRYIKIAYDNITAWFLVKKHRKLTILQAFRNMQDWYEKWASWQVHSTYLNWRENAFSNKWLQQIKKIGSLLCSHCDLTEKNMK